jgi:hypothetical protein
MSKKFKFGFDMKNVDWVKVSTCVLALLAVVLAIMILVKVDKSKQHFSLRSKNGNGKLGDCDTSVFGANSSDPYCSDHGGNIWEGPDQISWCLGPNPDCAGGDSCTPFCNEACNDSPNGPCYTSCVSSCPSS